ALPDGLDPATAACVEPGGNALRAIRGANLDAGQRLLVIGPGTIGLLVVKIASAQGIDVHLLGRRTESIEFEQSVGFHDVCAQERLPSLRFDATVDAPNAAAMPSFAV